VLRIRDVYPGSYFFHLGSRVKKIPDPESGSTAKNLIIFIPRKLFSKLSKKLFGMFIADPDYFPIPDSSDADPGVEKALDPGSGSATLVPI
jgi:hypothetical protein